MLRTFELTGDEATLRLMGKSPASSTAYAGWEYRAEIKGPALHVATVIADDNPASFMEFFESLSQDREGWPETRGYESLDGTLHIAATHDRATAVRFEVRLRAGARSGFDWSVNHRISVKAADLPQLAQAARAFVK